MQNEDSQQILRRFFEALYFLKKKRIIKGISTFLNQYNIDHRNFYRLKREPARDSFQTAWLMYLVNDYNVSPKWLLTGKGDILNEPL